MANPIQNVRDVHERTATLSLLEQEGFPAYFNLAEAGGAEDFEGPFRSLPL